MRPVVTVRHEGYSSSSPALRSFKERGARNALLKLEGSAREKGVIAASAGAFVRV